ncbi:hypothetical protein J6590_100761 [Homalodisca vitripennis]|nr:hypothetical protein J6590_100761 [Homalodisca vitripennis]
MCDDDKKPYFSILCSWNWIHPNWQLLPTDSCGQVAPDDGLRPRVLGGVAVDIAEYPWMAYVQDVISNSSNTKTFACGGSIINDKYILTAAHCFMHEEISSGQFLRKDLILLILMGHWPVRGSYQTEGGVDTVQDR